MTGTGCREAFAGIEATATGARSPIWSRSGNLTLCVDAVSVGVLTGTPGPEDWPTSATGTVTLGNWSAAERAPSETNFLAGADPR